MNAAKAWADNKIEAAKCLSSAKDGVPRSKTEVP